MLNYDENLLKTIQNYEENVGGKENQTKVQKPDNAMASAASSNDNRRTAVIKKTRSKTLLSLPKYDKNLLETIETYEKNANQENQTKEIPKSDNSVAASSTSLPKRKFQSEINEIETFRKLVRKTRSKTLLTIPEHDENLHESIGEEYC